MKIEWKNCLRIGVSIFLLYLCIRHWTGLMSFLGLVMGAAAPLLIGVPLAATVYRLLQQAVNKKPAIAGG